MCGVSGGLVSPSGAGSSLTTNDLLLFLQQLGVAKVAMTSTTLGGGSSALIGAVHALHDGT